MSSLPARALEQVVRPADLVRSFILRLFGPRLAPLYRARASRVALVGVTTIAISLVLTMVAPLWLLALGPVILGVPHLLADLRYLVAREGLHRRWPVVLGIGIPLAAVSYHPSVTVGIFAVFGAALVARGSLVRKTAILVGAAAVFSIARRVGFVADVFFAHAHNLVAFGLWIAIARKNAGARWFVVVAFAVASAFVLVFGPTVVDRLGGLRGTQPTFDVFNLATTVAPDVTSSLALALLLFFAFAQSVHYAIWLRFVPEDAREREAPRPFASSVRAILAELGLPVVAIALASSLFIAGWAVLDLAAARLGYLRLAIFHGHLELAVAALLFCEGRLFGAVAAVRTTLVASPSR